MVVYCFVDLVCCGLLFCFLVEVMVLSFVVVQSYNFFTLT